MKKAIVMTAVMILLAGSLVVAQDVESSAGEAGVQSQVEERGGGCGCRNQGRAASQEDAGCWSGKPGRGGKGMRHGQERGRRMGQGQGQGKGKGMGKAGRGRNQPVMQAIHALVHEYREDIVREVEDVPNGVATVTRSPENPQAVEALQRHVGEMKALLEGGGRIRAWDPLFSEIFDHYDEIEMVVEELEDGVRVTETSADPEVAKLIRAHARKVNEFVARGPAAVHESTPLPDDYRDSE